MKNKSLNTKIYLVLGIFVIASIAISLFGMKKLAESKDALNDIVSGPANRVTLILELRTHFFSQMISARDLILSEPGNLKTITGRLDETDAKIKKAKAELDLLVSEAGKKDLTNFMGLYGQWWENSLKIRESMNAGKRSDAEYVLATSGKEIRREVMAIFDALVVRNNGFMKDALVKAEDDYNASRLWMNAISFFGIIIGFVVATYVLRETSKSINQVIASLTENSGQVTSAAHQIASSSEELSQAATEQASSLEETAASIEEMSSMVQKNAENARRTSQLATDSHSSAEKGKSVVIEMIGAIDDISESNNAIMNQIDDSNQKIGDIVKVISEIGEKTKVINDIVFQTKLLSFNASVEAARAGEHGKGFAVVAEEVGNLAQMSGNAAKEISNMLGESIKKVENMANETKQKVGALISDGKSKVDTGSRIAKQCGDVLSEIVENISTVNQMANEISTACQEQAQGVQEITKAMNQLDQVTQTNAATSEEAASAAEQLSSQSQSLRDTVDVLIRTVKGASAVTESHSENRAQAPQAAKKDSHKSTPSNVVSMKKPASKTSSFKPSFKAAVGSNSIPSEDDPRFEDV